MTTDDESTSPQESAANLEARIGNIESTIRTAQNIPADRQAELLEMIAGLKSELANLATTHHEEAASITRFVEASAHEASRSRKNPELADTAVSGLRLSIQGLEESHPITVGIVNRFATALSNMGL